MSALDIFDYDLSTFNETDVREAIVAPLLSHLGYRRGGRNDIRTEQSLTYSRSFLGRKKPGDPVLRGRADYTLDVERRIRWVIEAKAPGEPLDADVVEQCYSYAVHAEVGAVYYCVTNGHQFEVYITSQGTHAAPIFACSYTDLRAKLPIIENVLGPEAILRANPTYVLDLGPSLGRGLGSSVRIVNGRVDFERNSLNLGPMNGMIMTISSGSVEHHQDGGMVAKLSATVMNARMQALNERLGLDKMILRSPSSCVSNDPQSPTVFTSSTTVDMAAGEVVLDITTWTDVRLPFNLTGKVETLACGSVQDRLFTGTFQAVQSFMLPPPLPPQSVRLMGAVTLQLV